MLDLLKSTNGESAKAVHQTDIYCSPLIEIIDEESGEDDNVTTSKNDSGSLLPSSVGVGAYTNSLWSPHLADDYHRALGSKFKLFLPILLHPLHGLQVFRSLSSSNLFPFNVGQTREARPNALKNPVNSRDAERASAQYRVNLLEEELRQLQEELRQGYRDMDTVQAEIRKRQEEITRLKRQYINFFYFF